VKRDNKGAVYLQRALERDYVEQVPREYLPGIAKESLKLLRSAYEGVNGS
jgi:hypothetical protein